jgi:hypothetical protein
MMKDPDRIGQLEEMLRLFFRKPMKVQVEGQRAPSEKNGLLNDAISIFGPSELKRTSDNESA